MNTAATYQPELSGYNTQVFAPVCLLNHKYYLDKYPDYYFIVRKDRYDDNPDLDRVCLYRQGAVNVHLRGDNKPFDLWLTNEVRGRRMIKTLYRDMEEVAVNMGAAKQGKKPL